MFPILTSPSVILQISRVDLGVMDEQTGSPAANPDNNSQRNGDEVRGEHTAIRWHIFPVFPLQVKIQERLIKGRLLPEISRTCLFFLSSEASTWQLAQGEEKEEANEGQQRTQSPLNRLRPLHE